MSAPLPRGRAGDDDWYPVTMDVPPNMPFAYAEPGTTDARVRALEATQQAQQGVIDGLMAQLRAMGERTLRLERQIHGLERLA